MVVEKRIIDESLDWIEDDERVLNSIDRNWIYFKIEKGYTLEVSNIVMSVDWSKRVYYQGKPAYHFKVERHKVIR